MIPDKHFMMFSSTFLFAMLLSWWGWASYSTPVTFKNPPGSLFENTTLVDLYNGSMEDLSSWIQQHSITLVMFYTSWSGQCVKAAPEVLSAHLMIDSPDVSIVSINCWVGQCRQAFPSLSFPRLFLYHGEQTPVEYLGDIKAHKILGFIQLSIRPFQYIGSEEILKSFRQNHDSNVIAYLDPSMRQRNKKFSVLYTTSLHLINQVNAPKIGVILQKELATSLGLFDHGNVLLNSHFFATKFYPSQANYTKDNVFLWIINNSRKLVNYLTPDNNVHYTQQLRHTSLILAVPDTGVDPELLNEFHKAALEYYDCYCLKEMKEDHSQAVSRVTHTTECPIRLSFHGQTYVVCSNYPMNAAKSIWGVSSLYTMNMEDMFQCVLLEDSESTRFCSTMRAKRNHSYGYAHSMCCHNRLLLVKDEVLTVKNISNTLDEIESNSDNANNRFNNKKDILNKMKELLRTFPELTYPETKRTTDNEPQQPPQKTDGTTKLMSELFGDSLNNHNNNNANVDLKTKNKLLQFFTSAIDVANVDDQNANKPSLRALLEGFFPQGVSQTINVIETEGSKKLPTPQSKIKKAAVPLESTPIGDVGESHVTERLCGMNAPCCTRTLNSFRSNLSITDFRGLACETNKTLSFYLLDYTRYKYLLENAGVVSEQPSLLLVDLQDKTHFRLKEKINYLSIANFVLKFTLGELVRDYLSLHKTSHNPLHQDVVELTTDTFHEEIFGNKMHVFLMFYTSWCGVCKPANLIFLRLMKKYKKYNVKFARIDNDRNELPWQYMTPSYPSFVLFPTNRKDVSFAYPKDLEITVDNFVEFLDSHL